MLDLGSYILHQNISAINILGARALQWSYILLHTCILIDAYSVPIKMKRKGDMSNA